MGTPSCSSADLCGGLRAHGLKYVIFEHVATPFAPVLARLIPAGELLTALALILGFWIPAASLLALFMVLNFHFGTAAFYAWDFLRDGTGPPVIGGRSDWRSADAISPLRFNGSSHPAAAAARTRKPRSRSSPFRPRHPILTSAYIRRHTKTAHPFIGGRPAMPIRHALLRTSTREPMEGVSDMKRRKILVIAFATAIAFGAAYALAAENVTICHRPPGNNAKAQTLTVGAGAVPAHLAHGDALGACSVSPHS